MKRIVFFAITMFGLGFTLIDNANARSCLLATESGSAGGEYCDDGGDALIGLPKHELDTYSKKGTKSLCNNVNAFADYKEAKEYAFFNEYYDTNPSQEQNSYNGCYLPKCKYANEAACISATGKPCCKSLVNDTCWNKCDICKFNSIDRFFYPYADKILEGCELVGSGGLDYHSAILVSVTTNSNMNNINNKERTINSYKINTLRNIVPNESWDTEIWTCDTDAFLAVMQACNTASTTAKLVSGFSVNSTYAGHLCIDGEHMTIPTTNSTNSNVKDALRDSFINEYGGCPTSAIRCNNHGNQGDMYHRYYSTENECETKMQAQGNHNPCASVKTYNKFGDQECWHGTRQCSDFGHGTYVVGKSGLTCPDDSVAAVPYLNKNGQQLKISDNDCEACECITGLTRLQSCNDIYYAVMTGYYRAGEQIGIKNVGSTTITGITREGDCAAIGYTTMAADVTKSFCTACPYNAMYWKCPGDNGSNLCKRKGYVTESENIMYNCDRCPFNSKFWKCS